MALDGCALLCKYILFIFNLIFAVLGMVFMGLGLWLRFSNSTRPIFEVEELQSSTFVIFVAVLIALGVVMLIMVSFGDYGACSEKRCALQVFSALLTIASGAYIGFGLIAYYRQDEVRLRLVELYSNMYALFLNTGDPIIGTTLTFIHNMLHCCGVNPVRLLEVTQETCPKPDGILEHIVMPSCPLVIADVYNSRAPLVMGIFLGTGALLITALICALVLVHQMKKHQQAYSTQYVTVY